MDAFAVWWSQSGGFRGLSLKRESHAARWGLMRGYSGKTTKWVDFVRTGSTQRKREEPCPNEKSSGISGWASRSLFCGADVDWSWSVVVRVS